MNVFESFLPQLLRYPNPADPLNGEAAALHQDNIEKYNAKVRDYVSRYAAGDGRSPPEDDRKISSESSTTASTAANSDLDNDTKEGEQGEDDIDDGASDVSNMSDL